MKHEYGTAELLFLCTLWCLLGMVAWKYGAVIVVGRVKLGSLFDGSGTAPLAAAMCGIEPVWASEVEPYPIKVTAARFPEMKHLGDITRINGTGIEPVDIISGGSPCQDLSVAGKQAGLMDGKRSHLFFEMTRIIKEMRDATNGKYPRYIIWENVPGAFSSNKGRDFHAVLQAFAEIADPDVHVPEPKQKASGSGFAWKYAGYVAGDGWSIAWRTVDAQYWGVPQRRRRIYLIADFGGERADEILFERTRLSGYPKPRRKKRETVAADAGRSFAGSCVAFTYRGRDGGCNVEAQEERSYALRTPSGGGSQANICYSLQGNCIDRNAAQNGSGIAKDTAHTINSTDRHGVAFAADCRNGALNEEISGTLQVKPNGGQSLNYQNPVVYSSGSFGTLSEGVGCLGTGTRATAEMVAVYPEITGSLCANSHPGSYTGQDAFNNMLPVVPSDKPPRKYIVRRLTPLECCRLQGFPDWWTEGDEDYPLTGIYNVALRYVNPHGKIEGSDSAKYKMWGNGMALPNMLHVMHGIVKEDQYEPYQL